MATSSDDGLLHTNASKKNQKKIPPEEFYDYVVDDKDLRQHSQDIWDGGNQPLKASYGKMMMWFFIVSDALTFTGFLIAYGFMRFKFGDLWPVAEEVFTHFPFLHGDHPLLYVALMTFILIVSSVTMVLAVDYGHKMNKSKVTTYLFLTIIGGLVFLLSQAWEWSHFIHGEYGAVKTAEGQIAHLVDKSGHKVSIRALVSEHDASHEREKITIEDLQDELRHHKAINLRNANGEILKNRNNINEKIEGGKIIEGANLTENEYGPPLFGDMFFFITGFHGFHVFTGVVINIIIFINVLLGTYQRRKSYEMVEKVGLYWHFVDLVWVFVFTFFYLV